VSERGGVERLFRSREPPPLEDGAGDPVHPVHHATIESEDDRVRQIDLIEALLRYVRPVPRRTLDLWVPKTRPDR
jgi:hypothetical protein